MAGRIAWINVAPVKGMALEQRHAVELEPFGVLDNRRFYVIGESDRLLNGKQLGELQQIAVHWDETDSALRFRFPDGSVAAFRPPATTAPVPAPAPTMLPIAAPFPPPNVRTRDRRYP